MSIRNVFTFPLLAAALLAGSAGAFAQTAPASPAPADAASPAPAMGMGHHHKNRMMSALESLGLSDDQKSKIKGFMTSYRDSRSSTTPETRAQLREQVEGVLTPDQRTQFEAQMKPHAQASMAPNR